MALIVAIPFAFAAVHLVRGAGYVLDDWFLLRNAHFEGAWAAAGDAQGTARPGSYPVFALVFGVFGKHPVPGLLLMAAMSATTAVLTLELVARFVERWVAVVAALLWVLLPTHTSTDAWLTCSIIAASQLLLTLALWLATSPDRSTTASVVSWLLLAASILTYEASVAVAVVGAIALPWMRTRQLDRRYAVGALVACGLPSLWILSHWYSGKSVQATADPARLVLANFGWGITPDGPASPLVMPLVLVVLAGVVVAVARIILSDQESGAAEHLVVVGLAVMVLGFAPFARYYYEPQGAGDRANYLSAVGGALVWAGLAALLARVDRRLALAAVGGLLVLGAVARLERIEVWSAAGRDAQAIADAVVRDIPAPDPEARLVLGPEPIIRWNVAAFLDQSNISSALAVAYGRPSVDAWIARDPKEWDAAPEGQRFDMWPVSRLDDVGVLGG